MLFDDFKHWSKIWNQGSKSEAIFRIEIDSRSSKPKIFRIEIDSSSSKTKIFRIEIDSSSSRYRISWLEADSSSRKSKISRLQSNKMRFNRKETLAKKSANDIEVSHGIKMIWEIGHKKNSGSRSARARVIKKFSGSRSTRARVNPKFPGSRSTRIGDPRSGSRSEPIRSTDFEPC